MFIDIEQIAKINVYIQCTLYNYMFECLNI